MRNSVFLVLCQSALFRERSNADFLYEVALQAGLYEWLVYLTFNNAYRSLKVPVFVAKNRIASRAQRLIQRHRQRHQDQNSPPDQNGWHSPIALQQKAGEELPERIGHSGKDPARADDASPQLVRDQCQTIAKVGDILYGINKTNAELYRTQPQGLPNQRIAWPEQGKHPAI